MRILLLSLLFASTLALPSARADRLTIGVSQYAASLNHLLEASVAQSYLLGMTTRPLTLYDAEWNLVCGVCKRLPSFENGLAQRRPLAGGGMGVAVTYELKPDLAWDDGTPVTAQDFKLAWEIGGDPAVGALVGEGYRRILEVTVVDDHTITFLNDRVTFNYNASAIIPLPAHLEEAIYRQDPGSYATRTLYDTNPAAPGLAFGPYRIVEARAGSELLLERNPHWSGKQPVFDQVKLVTINNTAALEANLLSGAIDMIAGELGIAVPQALAFERRHGADYRVLFRPSLAYEHIDVNLDRPFVADRRVRQALLYAIDRQAIVDRLFGDKQPVAISNLSPLSANHSDDVPHYPYDPEKAAQLLEEAGWRLDGKQRKNAGGDSLVLTIGTTAGDRTRELVQQVLQSQWRAVGVEVRILNAPARTFFGQEVRERDYGDLALFAWFAAPGSVPRTTLRSSEIPTAENGWAGQNYTGYRNPEVDRLIDELEITIDAEARKVLWADLQRIYMTDLPALPLYWRATAFILPKWLGNVRPTGNLSPTTYWIEDWLRN
ncbi:MAG: peptide ABC transporter substrate-binding protein [Rhodospirillales bacterium]|nr:peptide ABC transporter substrate-binding protein [Rhodospirillales bacterium]